MSRINSSRQTSPRRQKIIQLNDELETVNDDMERKGYDNYAVKRYNRYTDIFDFIMRNKGLGLRRMEEEWEKKVKREVEQVKQKHPLVFPVIISILSSVLFGLLTDCICEGIRPNEPKISINESEQKSKSLILDYSNMKLITDPDKTGYFKIYIYEESKEKFIGDIRKDVLQKFLDDSIEE